MMKKTIPTFSTDDEAEDFVDTADLTGYDLSGGTTVQFEFQAKSAHLHMRAPKPSLERDLPNRSNISDEES